MQSDLVYPDHFSSSNDVSLARFLDNQNHKCKERNFFHSKWQQCKQRWQCAVQCNLPKQTLKGEQKKTVVLHELSTANIVCQWFPNCGTRRCSKLYTRLFCFSTQKEYILFSLIGFY